MSIHIQSFRGEAVDGDTLRDIFKIEQDMWAREKGLGEYIYCENCGKVSSKEGVYGDLEKEIRLKTVADIEKILGNDNIPCPCCNSGNTQHIRGEDYFEKIKRKFGIKNSFSSVMRDTKDKVSGFMYGYLGPVNFVYETELSVHFKPEVIQTIYDILGIDQEAFVFSISGVGTNEEYMRLSHLCELMKSFFSGIPEKYDDVTGIGEAVIGSTMMGFYKYMGASGTEIFKNTPDLLKCRIPPMDILIHPQIADAYKTKSFNMKDFLITQRNSKYIN